MLEQPETQHRVEGAIAKRQRARKSLRVGGARAHVLLLRRARRLLLRGARHPNALSTPPRSGRERERRRYAPQAARHVEHALALCGLERRQRASSSPTGGSGVHVRGLAGGEHDAELVAQAAAFLAPVALGAARS